MTDQMQQYFQEKNDARASGLPATTFITRDGVQIVVVPADDALGEILSAQETLDRRATQLAAGELGGFQLPYA